MKIGVISDTHGHEQRFAKAVDKFFNDADLILHAGDVLYHYDGEKAEDMKTTHTHKTPKALTLPTLRVSRWIPEFSVC